MRTFITPDVSESGAPLRLVHDTKSIAVSDGDFYFVAECGSTEEMGTISPNGHSARYSNVAGAYVPCGECRKAAAIEKCGTAHEAVATGIRDVIAGAFPKPEAAAPCSCTVTRHERQENRACPVHFPVSP